MSYDIELLSDSGSTSSRGKRFYFKITRTSDNKEWLRAYHALELEELPTEEEMEITLLTNAKMHLYQEGVIGQKDLYGDTLDGKVLQEFG